MDLQNITAKEIQDMDYNQIIGLTKETNRPPGGRRTVYDIISRACIDRKSKILEIGTSTGFTAIEIAKLIPCDITSVDINEMSLEEARVRAQTEGLDNITFMKADVNNLPFDEGTFDLVIVGNVLSLMSNREQAFAECRRVCTQSGFIAAVPMFYVEEPSEKLVKDVSAAIQVDITPLYQKDWDAFFDLPDLEVYFSERYKFDYMSDEAIETFVKNILARAHLKTLTPEAFSTLTKEYRDYMFLFRENLSKMGFSVLLLSNKMVWEDPELYTSVKLN